MLSEDKTRLRKLTGGRGKRTRVKEFKVGGDVTKTRHAPLPFQTPPGYIYFPFHSPIPSIHRIQIESCARHTYQHSFERYRKDLWIISLGRCLTDVSVRDDRQIPKGKGEMDGSRACVWLESDWILCNCAVCAVGSGVWGLGKLTLS